jgi:hypothetical protein
MGSRRRIEALRRELEPQSWRSPGWAVIEGAGEGPPSPGAPLSALLVELEPPEELLLLLDDVLSGLFS